MKSDAAYARSDKRLYLDVLRAWACISVIVIHICAYYSQTDVAGVNYLIGNAFNSVARSAVPLFVMISGALMLDEGYRCTKEKLKRMIHKRAMFFVIWSLLYALLFHVAAPLLKGEALDAQAFLESLLGGYYHLWFIPMLIGLYLILPLLRLWVRKENREYVAYYLALCFVFTSALPFFTEKLSRLFPAASCLYSLTDNLHLQYVAGYTGYYVLGWYLNTFEVRHRDVWYAAGAAGLLLTFGGTQVFSLLAGEDKNFYSVFAVGVVCFSSALFLWAKSLFGSRGYDQSIFCRFVRVVCAGSMGIYAIHAAVIRVLFKLFGLGHAGVMIPLIAVMTFVVSLTAARILRLMPLAKDYMV